MGVVKEVSELKNTEKSFVIGIPVLSIFWFVALYLFHPVFVRSNQLYISACMAFCLAVCWYFSVIAVAIFANPRTDFQKHYIGSFVYSIVYLSVCIFVNYMYTKLAFDAFLYICLGFFISNIAHTLWLKIINHTQADNAGSNK